MKHLLTVALLLFSFNSVATEFPAAARRDQGLLGDGFDTNTGAFKAHCVDGDWKYAGYTSASGEFIQQIEEKELEKQLGISGSYGEKMGAAKMSAAAGFAKNSKSRGFSVSAIYRTKYTGYNFKLGNQKIAEGAKKCLNPRDNTYVDGNGETCFIPQCGNEFLEQITTTAGFFFSIRVEFSNKEELDSFNASFSFKSPTKEMSASLINEVKQKSRNAKITVAVLQVGGHIDKMSRAFNRATADGKGSSEDYKSCGLGDLPACLNIFVSAIDYATGSGTDQFPAQLAEFSNFKEGDVITQMPSGVSVDYYITKPYQEMEGGVTSPFNKIVQKEVADARKEITDLYTKVADLENDVQAYLDNFITLTAAQKNFFQRVYNDLSKYKDSIVEASKVCMPGMFQITSSGSYDSIIKGIETCPAVYTKVKNAFNLDLYNRGLLFDIRPEKFAQFCELSLRKAFKPADQERMSDLQKNIQGYLTAAKRIEDNMSNKPAEALPAYIEQVTDSKATCEVISRRLATVKKLDLSDLELTSLEPLKEFSHFEEINLTNNKIKSLTYILGNFNLKVLKVGQNSLSTLRHIDKFKKLTTLVMNSNFVRSVDELNRMPSLKRVDIRDNFEDLSCKTHLANIYSCLDYTLRGDVQISSSPATLSNEFFHPASVTLKNGRILVVAASGKYEIYDPQSHDFVIQGEVAQPGRGHTLTALQDGRALLAGGERNQYGLSIFDPSTNQFQAVGKTLFQHAFHTATELQDGRVLIVGGAVGPQDFNALKLLSSNYEIFNPSLNAIENPEKFRHRTTVHARGWHTANLLPSGKVLIVGGHDMHLSASISMEVFDPATEDFQSLKAKLAGPRSSHVSTLLNDGRVLFVGGFQPIKDADGLISLQGQPLVELYNPKTSKIEQLEEPYLATVRSLDEIKDEAGNPEMGSDGKPKQKEVIKKLPVGGLSGVKLSNGLVLFLGGTSWNRQAKTMKDSDLGDTADASIFDPVSSTFLPLDDKLDHARAFMSHARIEDVYGKEKIFFFGSEGPRTSMSPEIFYFNKFEREGKETLPIH